MKTVMMWRSNAGCIVVNVEEPGKPERWYYNVKARSVDRLTRLVYLRRFAGKPVDVEPFIVPGCIGWTARIK